VTPAVADMTPIAFHSTTLSPPPSRGTRDGSAVPGAIPLAADEGLDELSAPSIVERAAVGAAKASPSAAEVGCLDKPSKSSPTDQRHVAAATESTAGVAEPGPSEDCPEAAVEQPSVAKDGVDELTPRPSIAACTEPVCVAAVGGLTDGGGASASSPGITTADRVSEQPAVAAEATKSEDNAASSLPLCARALLQHLIERGPSPDDDDEVTFRNSEAAVTEGASLTDEDMPMLECVSARDHASGEENDIEDESAEASFSQGVECDGLATEGPTPDTFSCCWDRHSLQQALKAL